ncbi:MAG: ABC transporter permease [Chloroflexota bacterium]
MTVETSAPDTIADVAEAPPGPAATREDRFVDGLVLAIGPVILALLTCAVLLALLGRDPIAFYRDVLQGGVLRASGLQDSITRMAPVLLIAAGLVVAFRASLWNLGADGQYLLAAALVAGLGPTLVASLPAPVAWVVLALVAMAVGGAWTIIPAWLKARHGLNEIVTTLMMTFIGIGIANILVKGPFKGPQMVPQTGVIPAESMLADLPGTTIHIGVIVAVVVVLLVHLLLTRTSFGTRVDVLGANPRAAEHMGVDVPRLILLSFMLSGALVGLAAAVDIVGVFGYVRADWDPAYGLKVVPLVFLARLNALAVIPFAIFFGILSVGGDYATRRAELPADFLLIVVGLLLLFMVVAHWASARRGQGRRLLSRGGRRDTGSATTMAADV